MAEATLTLVKATKGLEGRLTPRWLDRTEPVGAWVGEKLAAVLLPTADTLRQVREIAGDVEGDTNSSSSSSSLSSSSSSSSNNNNNASDRLVILFNPQWSPPGGNVVSDFGYGAEAAAAELFVASFVPALSTSRLSLFGDDVRIHHCWGGLWQVHYVWPNGKGDLIELDMFTFEKFYKIYQTICPR